MLFGGEEGYVAYSMPLCNVSASAFFPEAEVYLEPQRAKGVAAGPGGRERPDRTD